MRVMSLEVKNLLNFEDLKLDLDGGTHTIIGPNGAGKSNIVRMFDLIACAVASVAARERGTASSEAIPTLRALAGAHQDVHDLSRPATVRLALRFSTEDEKRKLAAFACAGILFTLVEEWRVQGSAQILGAWAATAMPDEAFDALLTGSIVLTHVGMGHLKWDIGYEFTHDGGSFTWFLDGPGGTRRIVHTDDNQADAGQLPVRELRECVLGVPRQAPDVSLPSPLPHFEMSRLLPPPGTATKDVAMRTDPASFDEGQEPFRRAIQLLKIPSQEKAPAMTFSLAHVLNLLLSAGMVTMGEQMRGVGDVSTETHDSVWGLPLGPAGRWTASSLPMRLFALKNGADSDRQRFAAIQRTFSELASGRSFDVAFEIAPSVGHDSQSVTAGQALVVAQSPVREGAGHVEVDVGTVNTTVSSDGGYVSSPSDLAIHLHGAGTWEALLLSELLVDSDDRFIILDEPGATLHPTWQRALRARLHKAPGQFLVVTHSTSLVPLSDKADLSRLARLDNPDGRAQLHQFPNTLNHSDINRITRELSLSTDAASLLFSRGAVLLEGETEFGLLPTWFAKAAVVASTSTPDGLDLGFHSVSGDDRFRIFLMVLQSLAVPWVLVCDGAVFDVAKRRGRHAHIFQQALDAGLDAPDLGTFLGGVGKLATPKMSSELWNQERELGKAHGIFTLARGWTTADGAAGKSGDESFEAFVEHVVPGMLAKAEDAVGSSKVRQGRWIADKIECPTEVIELYRMVVERLRNRGLDA